MAAGCERLRDRHGARWVLPFRPPLCLACAVETLGDGGASLVRKKHALCRLRDALAWQALPVVQLLAPDERGCLCLIGTLFGMCHAVEDSDTQDQFGEVLVQLIVELKSEQYLRCILDESQKELCKATTRRGSLPTFTLLGKLADAVPVFADILVVEHSNLVDHLLVGLMYPNEGVKAAVCYLYGKLYSSPVGTEKLSAHFEERLCGLFLNTFGHAQTKELQINCLGLLKELLKSDRFVSILMNNSKPEEESESSDLLEGENPLPLILKKLLLTRDEMLQAASSHCMAAVLVHSPSRYAPAFIHADVPEFLFECLMCNSEILIWSVYCSLLLLTEERLFFSKCHTVYGIESLVRSLQNVLQLNNVELHKQGLLLFTEIVKRQPAEIKLFTNRGICIDAIDVLMKTVDCPVLEVVVEAVKAVAAFLRKDHLSSPPVPYENLQKLLEAVLKRCVDLFPPHCSNKHEGDFLLSMSQSRVSWKHGQLLLNTLESFRNACRLAVELQSDPMAQENAFTAPCSESKETLNNFSEFLLRICDSLCTPMVMNYLERAVSSSVMEVFISALNTLFTVVPNMRDKFSKKLASSCFIRLTLELKARFCSVQSNPALNQACSSFLCNLCLSLYSATEKERTCSQEEQEMSELLQKSLPQLNYTIAESLLLLAENPEPLSLDQSLCNHQHCFILLLYFAYTRGDRFVPEAELFLAIRNFLLLAQDHRDWPPTYVLRAVLYLLAVCQDKGKALDSRSLCTVKRILDNLPDLSLVYIHCPLLLKFFLHYPELMGRFGHQVLQLWFSWEDCNHVETEEAAFGTSDQLNNANPLLPILKSNSSILLILLDLVCSSSVEVAQKVLMALRTFLEKNEDVFVCDLLRNQFLQILQQLLVESSSVSLQVVIFQPHKMQNKCCTAKYSELLGCCRANRNLPILLSLLFLVQLRSKGMRELDSTDFKLLHQVSNLCGKCRPKDIDLLQPSLNFLYCSLHQTTPCSQQRAVAVLLSNVSLLELLQKVLECTWMWSFPSEPTYLSPEDALLSSGWLLAASLLIYQHRYNTEVHQTLSLDLRQVLNAVVFRNKKPVLLLVSIVQFLRAILRQNFSSLLVTIVQNTAQGATQSQPSLLEDAALHPLTTQQVFSLVVSLQNLLVHVYLQKDLLLSQAVVACLETLLEYLYVRNHDVALHVASQPWHRFLLLTLLNGSQKSILQPEILRLMTLFLKYQSSNIISQKEIGQILQEVAEANLLELPEATSQALHLFLCQIQSSHCQVEPVQAQTIQTLLEHLPEQTSTCAKHQDIVEAFHPSGHFCGPPLDTLQQVHVSPALRTPHLGAALQVSSRNAEQRGRITSFAPPVAPLRTQPEVRRPAGRGGSSGSDTAGRGGRRWRHGSAALLSAAPGPAPGPQAVASRMDFLWICLILLAVVLPEGSLADLEKQRMGSGLEIYKKLFEVKRKDQMNALKNLIELNDINQQYKIIDIMLKGLFKVLEDSRAVLIAADVPPDGPFPQDEKLKDAYSHVVENTAFFGDVVLRFPKIVHHYFDRNSNWNNLIRWGIGFCNLTGVFEQGPHSQLLGLMAQELGISEKSPNYRNPFKADHSEFFPSADTFQKALREEEKRRRKEEKRKEIRKGPRISRSQSEL